MDINNIGGIAGIVGLVVSVGGAIFTVINHKKCRSRCCQWSGEISFDVDNTSPISKETPSNENAFIKS